jgi:hypothetical protein
MMIGLTVFSKAGSSRVAGVAHRGIFEKVCMIVAWLRFRRLIQIRGVPINTGRADDVLKGASLQSLGSGGALVDTGTSEVSRQGVLTALATIGVWI